MAPLKKDQRQGATSTLFCAATTGEVGEVSLSPHDAGAGERASAERRARRAVGQGEGWGGQCEQGVSVEGIGRGVRLIGEGGVAGRLSVLEHQWSEAKGRLRDNIANQ
jgi:hypothetical protein